MENNMCDFFLKLVEPLFFQNGKMIFPFWQQILILQNFFGEK